MVEDEGRAEQREALDGLLAAMSAALEPEMPDTRYIEPTNT